MLNLHHEFQMLEKVKVFGVLEKVPSDDYVLVSTGPNFTKLFVTTGPNFTKLFGKGHMLNRQKYYFKLA